MSKRRSSIEGDIDNKVLDSSLSAESSDETEKLIVDLNSASELKISPYNSRVNAKAINAKCKVSQSEMVNLNHDLNGNTEKVPKTFQSKKKQTSTESDSDFASKLQYCVDMLSDSDPNETLETSTNRVQKVNDMEPCVLKHVKDPNERELMSPPKSVPKKKKCENKNLLDSESQKSANRSPNVSENVAPDSVSNILTDSDLNLVQTQSVVNRILDLSKSVALNVQTQNVTHRSPVENNYEEPKHNTISYFTWKIPQQLTFSDKNLLSCKYQEQTRVFGIQDVPLSDPRTKITRDNISDTNIAPKTPKLVPYTRVNEAAAIDLMLKDRNKKVNKSASFGETHKDHKKKTSSKSKDSEKESGTMADITDNDGVKIRLDLPHKRQERETAVKTSRSDIASKDTKQQKTIISKNEDREMQCTSTDMKKTTKKTSTKKLSSLKSNKGEKSVSKTKPLTQKSAKSKEKSAISNDLRHEFVTENITNKELEHSERKSDTVETDSLPSPRSHLPLVDTSVVKDESHSIELTTLESVTKPNESSGISNQFQSTEAIEVKSEPNSEPAPPTSSGLNAFSGMFMTNLAGSSNETEFLKRLKKMEEEIQMMKSAAIQSLQSKVIFKTENVFTSQESDGQQILEAGTNDNPIIIPSSSDVATDISRALVNESKSTFSESGNVVGNQSDNRPDKSQSTNKSSENVSKDVDCPLSPLSPVKTSNIGKSVSKTVPIRGDADSSSVHSALQTCNSKNMTKVSMNTTEDSNSSNNSSFSVHSTDSSVSSSYNTNNVRNSFTKHETLVSCNISDTDETLSESSEDDMDIETDLHYDNNMDINQNATEVLKTDLDMSSDSEDASKHHSNILPQNVQTPNHVVKNMKTPMKQDIRSPWNRISPVPKFVSPENVNCDSKLLALVNLATLDLHLSGHDVPFENKALSSKNENNSNASPEVLSSTPCFRKTRSHGKSFKTCLPELKSNDVIDSNMVKFDNRLKNNESNSSFLTPVNSPSIEKRDTSKASLTESPIPMASSDTPTSPEFEIEKSIITDGLKTHSDQPPAEIQLPQEVKRSPNIEDFKIFQSVENDTVEDTPEPISEKEDGEITQDSLIVNDNQKQLSVNTDSVYFVIDTKVDENDELFKCSDAENSLSEKPSKRLVTPKKKQMCSVKTRSSPRIRTNTLHDRLGVRDRTERRASDANNKRKKRRSPSPRLPRSNGRRRLYDNDNIKSDHKSDSKPMRKPLTDSPRDRDRDNERLRHKDEPRWRNSRDRSNRDRNRSGNCRSRS
ncbi:hypothetical protein LOTGIDRAFT_228905 [Lottia gigantea]|uniref:Uncharacterized protein n=1 Tax=Lottia gigantea TaxID=225164 RepID=V4A1Z3_LOTGI|nr:hypothetical protein LOTGIDRAFT_228905 [Lottia gigantea]ESO88935.1 hypothetical protein LOTGIDRAFT_228905 [Lottia gigantea]